MTLDELEISRRWFASCPDPNIRQHALMLIGAIEQKCLSVGEAALFESAADIELRELKRQTACSVIIPEDDVPGLSRYDRFNRLLFELALLRHSGNVSLASKWLGISRACFYRTLRALRIPRRPPIAPG